MRIALFTKDFRGGGAERVMVNLARGLSDQSDIEVDMIVCKAAGPNLALVPSGVRVVDLKCRQMLTSLPSLVKYIAREKPVAILSALEHANVIAIAARSIAKSQSRMVISVHNCLSQDIVGSKNIKKRFELPFIRAFYPFADAIVAVSNGVADDLAELTRIKRADIDVIYNPVVSDALIQRSHESLDHPWFSEGQPPVVLNVGRLTYQKDQAMLIRAFSKLRRKHQARLLILGDGEERESLERLAKENGLKIGNDGDLLLPGFVENPYKYMAKSAVFALSSRFEGLPTVLIEALACGSAVVSTDCPSGPSEILDGEKWGLLAPVGDDETFSEKLASAITLKNIPTREAWTPYEFDRSALAYRNVLLAGS